MKDRKYQLNNRRNFLKKGMAGVAGLTVIPSIKALDSQERTGYEPADKNNQKIIYRVLGRTGIKMPIVSMGSSSDKKIIEAALDTGIVYFDTAYVYREGVDETAFGEVFKGRPRDSFIIASKIFGPRDRSTGMPATDITPEKFKDEFMRNLDISLERLQLDYVDILYLHAADKQELLKLDMVRDVMKEIKEKGKARFIGISTHKAESIYTAVEEKIYDVILIAYNFRDEDGRIRDAIKHATDEGCGIVGMKALAGRYWDEEKKHPINPKAATKWILQDENIHTVIFSIKTYDELDMYWSLMNDLTITPEEKEDLKLGEKKDLSGMYCSQCEKCLPQCPYNMDIPKFMRSYMYVYGYQAPYKAKETLKLTDTSNIKCNQCPVCNIKCTMGFNIREKIKNVARVTTIPDEFLV